MFHVARITKATVTTKFVEEPKDIAPEFLEKSFGIFKGDVLYNAKIKFTDKAAELIQYQHWHKDQIVTKTQNGIYLEVPVSDDRELMMKILQYGSMAEIIEPASLRKKVAEEVQGMQKVYFQ